LVAAGRFRETFRPARCARDGSSQRSILAPAVRNTLRRLPLADGISLAIPATILALALGSNWSPSVRSVAGPLRWVGLLVVCALALGLALERGRPLRAIGWTRAAAAAFLAVAFASALCSVAPPLPAPPPFSFGVLR